MKQNSVLYSLLVIISVLFYQCDNSEIDPAPKKPFVFKWCTLDSIRSITLYTKDESHEWLSGSETYMFDFMVDWGDGQVENFSGVSPEVAHEFDQTSCYDISIIGVFPSFRVNPQILSYGDIRNIHNINDVVIHSLEIKQWGDIAWKNLEFDLKDLSITATDAPDLSEVENLDWAFFYTNISGDINGWDVSTIQSMKNTFQHASYPGSLKDWTVSNVENMNSLFSCSDFSGDLSSWNVQSVKDMSGMFTGTLFNGELGSWDVSNVQFMNSMFADSKFNMDLSGWNVSSVENMEGMFSGAAFNQDISGWDISNVTSFSCGRDARLCGIIAVDDFSCTLHRKRFLDGEFSTEYYDHLLKSWSEHDLKDSLYIEINQYYSEGSSLARQSIIDNHKWIIADLGQL